MIKLDSTNQSQNDWVVGFGSVPVEGQPFVLYSESLREHGVKTVTTTPIKHVLQINNTYTIYTANSEYLLEPVDMGHNRD